MDAELSAIAAGLSAELRARFTLVRKLGSGASGVVIEARERDRSVALKLVSCPGATVEHERFRRLMREAEVQARVRHPAVVQLYAPASTATRCGLPANSRWARRSPRS